MPSPSFARYAALLAGVLDTSGAEGGCADVRADAAANDDGGAGRAAELVTLDLAARRAAWTLRRPAATMVHERPSAMDPTYRDRVATPSAPDARLDRRG